MLNHPGKTMGLLYIILLPQYWYLRLFYTRLQRNGLVQQPYFCMDFDIFEDNMVQYRYKVLKPTKRLENPAEVKTLLQRGSN